jgi:Recombination endonuclease VII
VSSRAPSDKDLYEKDPFYRYLASTHARYYRASRKQQDNARRRRRPRAADSRDKERARRYGLSLQDYRAMLARQDAACAICRRSDCPLCVDHCHATGKVRGFLCRECNLGCYYNDDPSLTRAATAYLEAVRGSEEKAGLSLESVYTPLRRLWRNLSSKLGRHCGRAVEDREV